MCVYVRVASVITGPTSRRCVQHVSGEARLEKPRKTFNRNLKWSLWFFLFFFLRHESNCFAVKTQSLMPASASAAAGGKSDGSSRLQNPWKHANCSSLLCTQRFAEYKWEKGRRSCIMGALALIEWDEAEPRPANDSLLPTLGGGLRPTLWGKWD